MPKQFHVTQRLKNARVAAGGGGKRGCETIYIVNITFQVPLPFVRNNLLPRPARHPATGYSYERLVRRDKHRNSISFPGYYVQRYTVQP